MGDLETNKTTSAATTPVTGKRPIAAERPAATHRPTAADRTTAADRPLPAGADGFRLDGQVCVVTGGARGIGRAVALELAQAGASIIVNDLRHDGHTDELLKQLQTWGGRHRFIAADITRFDDVKRMRDEVMAEYGRLDVLVNNAGITQDSFFTKMTVAQWHAVIDVNLHGVFHCCKAFVDDMITNGHGRIVNISSIVGQTGNLGQANYAAAKAAVIGLTQTLARELSRNNITVNAIAPGFVDTDMVATIPEPVVNKILSGIPASRLAKPEEIAAAVRYLASPAAAYVTGQVLAINGGARM